MTTVGGGEGEVVHGQGYVGRGIVPTPLNLLSAPGQMSESDLVTRIVDFLLAFSTMFLLFSSL